MNFVVNKADLKPVQKFSHPEMTAKGEQRAKVDLNGLETLWFNTGTLCNLACLNCYIESTPRNDRLVYLSQIEVNNFLDELLQSQNKTQEIGFTGGEPFMNPDFTGMLRSSLERGFNVLVLTNAMRPMMKCA
ncbi:MAG: radical SAM protein, partial [Pseudomonadota bacterium]